MVVRKEEGVESYTCDQEQCWYTTTFLHIFGKHDGRCREPRHSHIYNPPYGKAGVVSSEAVVVGDKRVGIDIVDDDMLEEDGIAEINVRDVECIGERRGREKEMIYDIWDQLDILGGQFGDSMAEQFILILHEKDFDLFRFKEMVMSLKTVKEN